MQKSGAIIVLLVLTNCAFAEQPFPKFREQTIDPHIGKICYAVTLADVDGDSKQDIIAVSENRVVWYQNPTWKPRVIIEDQTARDNVCIAPHDIDGDGKIDFALGAGWTKIGALQWLNRGASLDEKWRVHAIGEEPWTHRMRWADVLGKEKPQLVISPLNATTGKGVRLTAFEIPANPEKDRWQPIVMNAELNAMHNHWHVDFDHIGAIDTLTASREGVHLIRRKGDNWEATRIGEGAESKDPKLTGSGEIKLGRRTSGPLFLATVEPMHGDTLAIYRPNKLLAGPWNRQVIDSGFMRGHALWTADMDGDGGDEIIFGHSDTPDVPGVNVYRMANDDITKWEKHVIDAGGVATEDLIVGDVTGDGRPDIVAGGRATHNVKLYVNTP